MALKQKKKWEAIVVGAGYNGLIAAAYLARAGLSVAVLERQHLMAALPLEEDGEQLEFDALEQLESPDLHFHPLILCMYFCLLTNMLNVNGFNRSKNELIWVLRAVSLLLHHT